MAIAAEFSSDRETLEEIAARLIYVLGLDKAINTCRSNAWHTVLPFVMAYQKAMEQPCQPFGFLRSNSAQRAPAMALPLEMAA